MLQKETEAYGSFSRPRVLARLPREAALLAVLPRAAPPRFARLERPWPGRSLVVAGSMAPLLRRLAKGLLLVWSLLSRAPGPRCRCCLPPRGLDMAATVSRVSCEHAPASDKRGRMLLRAACGLGGSGTAQTVPMVEVDSGCVGCDKESSRTSMNLQTALVPK